MKRRHTSMYAGLQLRQLVLWVALALGASTVALGQTESVDVTSATNSEIVVVTLVPVEGGGFTRDGEPFTGGRVTLEGGFEYVVSQATDGTWMALYQPTEVSVALGELGGMLTLVAQEDGTFTDADGMQVVTGQTWDAAGNTYRLTLGEDRVWNGTYVQPLPQTVEVGTQGTVTVTRAEDGSWWIGETGLMSGDTYELGTNVTGAANVYQLTLEDGEWTATYVPTTVTIAGTDLLATPNEDGKGYTVEESAMLAASGTGDVTVRLGGIDEMYHVWATDDGLAGARFDHPIKSNIVEEVDVKGIVAKPTLSSDNSKTDANELRTMVKVAGTDFSLGELLGSGSDTAMPAKTVREEVREEIAKLRDQTRTLVDLYNDDAIDRATFDSQVNSPDNATDKWDRADAEIVKLFGGTVELERESNPRRAVDAFDALLEALDSEAAFTAATAANGGGVFEFAELAAGAATRTYNATKWTAEAVFTALGNTRFGAAKRRERNNAKASGFNGALDQIQVFAWSTTDLLRRASEVQAAGNAYYTGRTHAADSDGNLYSGDMELSVRFARQQVDGLVRNLSTADGDRWEHGALDGEVENIYLPTAAMDRQGMFRVSGGDARVSFDRRAAGAREETITGRAGLRGRLLGRGETAGTEAIGTWQIANEGDDAGILIAGAFGVQRGEDRPDPSQPLVDDLKAAETALALAHLVKPDGENAGLLTQQQIDIDGSAFLALFGRPLRSLAQARAAFRAASSPVTLSDAEVDKVIAAGRLGNPETALSSGLFSGDGWAPDQLQLANAFNHVVQPKAHGARTLFSDNADAGTIVVWPTWTTGQGGPYARGQHPVWPETPPPGLPDRPASRNMEQDPRAVDQAARSYFRFELNKETLFGEGYGIVSEDRDAAVVMHEIPGETHVEVARKELTRLRSVLRSVIALDSADASATDRQFANDRRQELFTQIQNQLTEQIFGGTADNLNVFATRATTASTSSAWTAHRDYPVNGAGLAQDAQLLSDIDDVIAALSSEYALDEAFETGGIFADRNAAREYTGVLYEGPRVELVDQGNNDAPPGDALGSKVTPVGEKLVIPASHIFNKARARLLLVTESTDFTRLGAWTIQGSRFAADTLEDAGVHWGANGFHTTHQRPEPFVYSPLEQVEFSSAADRAFPAGTAATYRGKTVAVQHTVFYTGDVELKVRWRAQWGGADNAGVRKIGELALTVSNLLATNPGFNLNPVLRHGLRDYPAEVAGGFAVPRPGSFDVRSLKFEADVEADAEGMVTFGGPENNKAVEVTHDTLEGTRVHPGNVHGSGSPVLLPSNSDQWAIMRLDENGERLTGSANRLAWAQGDQIVWRLETQSGWTRKDAEQVAVNPGSAARAAFDHYYTSPDHGAGKMNVRPVLNRASIEGRFVGETGDGPRSVIGTWSIEGAHWLGVGSSEFVRGVTGDGTPGNSKEGDILGSFGAEFAP